jgi:hypothetical protein
VKQNVFDSSPLLYLRPRGFFFFTRYHLQEQICNRSSWYVHPPPSSPLVTKFGLSRSSRQVVMRDMAPPRYSKCIFDIFASHSWLV